MIMVVCNGLYWINVVSWELFPLLVHVKPGNYTYTCVVGYEQKETEHHFE